MRRFVYYQLYRPWVSGLSAVISECNNANEPVSFFTFYKLWRTDARCSHIRMVHTSGPGCDVCSAFQEALVEELGSGDKMKVLMAMRRHLEEAHRCT